MKKHYLFYRLASFTHCQDSFTNLLIVYHSHRNSHLKKHRCKRNKSKYSINLSCRKFTRSENHNQHFALPNSSKSPNNLCTYHVCRIPCWSLSNPVLLLCFEVTCNALFRPLTWFHILPFREQYDFESGLFVPVPIEIYSWQLAKSLSCSTHICRTQLERTLSISCGNDMLNVFSRITAEGSGHEIGDSHISRSVNDAKEGKVGLSNDDGDCTRWLGPQCLLLSSPSRRALLYKTSF